MLFIQDTTGEYRPAPEETIFGEAKRISSYKLRRGTIIRSSRDAENALQNKLADYEYEVFACLFLDSAHRVVEYEEMFRGSIAVNLIHPREVVKKALKLNAAAVILAHNHPSGNTEPSRADFEVTEKLKEILQIVDVRVLDHLIVGDKVVALSDFGPI